MNSLKAFAALTLVIVGVGNGSPCPAQTALKGAGSTFVEPMMDKWSREYTADKHGKVLYQGIGSGKGIDLLAQREVDFACTDAPLASERREEFAKSQVRVLHIPLVLGAVVPAYNVPGVAEDKPLRFTGPLLADIYRGKVTRWNDKAITILNPGADLPDEAITVVFRSDSSGTSYIWTDYLAKVSTDWTTGPTTRLTVKDGVGKTSNRAVAEYVAATRGAIGYLEFRYALAAKLPFGDVKNKAGHFVRADSSRITAAAESALKEIPDDLRFSLVNADGKEAYPICGAVWAILAQSQSEPGRRDALVDFLRWTISEGQTYASDLYYARLPKDLAALAQKQLEKVSVDVAGPSHDRLLRDGLAKAIDAGADLFNNKADCAGCCLLYEGALVASRPLLAHHPELQKAIDAGLAEAAQTNSMSDRAFVLRKALDQIRATLKAPQKTGDARSKD